MTIGEYKKLLAEVETMKRAADRAEGALSEVMKELKTQFGCNTIEEAEQLLKTLEAELVEAEAEEAKLTRRFKKKWGDKLEGLDED